LGTGPTATEVGKRSTAHFGAVLPWEVVDGEEALTVGSIGFAL